MTQKLTGAEIVMECLLREGVDVMFGYPGGAILPTYDAMTKYPQIHHVLTRHEQGASHMADGYARATGKVGVCIATSGPGATNLVTGLATAMMDSSAIVAITGQVPTAAIGSDAFQETDVTGVTIPVTKHNYLVTDIADLAHTIKEAFHIARTGRKGPVLIDVPKDVQNAVIEFEYPEEDVRDIPGYHPPSAATNDQVEHALSLIQEAERPVILAGHGILMSEAGDELMELAEKAQIPVTLTLLGKGAMPEDHPLVVGMMGMHGEAASNHAIQEADLLIALGMRFDDRVTGNLQTYAQHSRKIHVDIDPSELNKNVPVDVAIAGDLKMVLQQLNPQVEPKKHPAWINRIRDWLEDSSDRDILNYETEVLLSAQVIHDIWKYTHGNAITVSDVGQHQMLEAQYYPHQRPNTMLTSGGLGTMGFGFPAALGAKFGMPDEEVWAIVGDGGFQMTLCELATAKQENVNINIAIINNSFLGMVRQWQELFYDKRYQSTPMYNPDFVALAAAYGIPGMKVTHRDQIEDSVAFARQHQGPTLIEYVVEKEEMVYPMVPSGATLNEMKRRPKPNEVQS